MSNSEPKKLVVSGNAVDAYHDGRQAGLHLAHMLVAHMLDCPGAKKTDIVSETPEYKIGYVEALVNAMTAIEAKITEDPNDPAHSHDHHHLQSETESQSHDQQSATASPVEPTGQS